MSKREPKKKSQEKNPCQCNGTGQIIVTGGPGILVPIPCPSCR